MESTWARFQLNRGRLEHDEEDCSQSSGTRAQTCLFMMIWSDSDHLC